jgi:ArsR family transcriptional regulator
MISIYNKNAKVFKAFCDENRLQVLELLQSGEKCACVLLEQFNIGQSTLSHHMKILIESGIVTQRKQGKWTYYSISIDGVQIAKKLIEELTTIKLSNEGEEKCK